MPSRRAIAAGLGTRIALRTFLLCCVCSLLPTLVIGVTVYTRIASEERSAAQTRLRDSAKRYGLELNARLNAAEKSLLRLAERRLAGRWAGDPASSVDRATVVKFTRLPLTEAGAIDNRNHPDSALQFHRESVRITNTAGKYAVEMLLVVSNDEQALEVSGVLPAANLWDVDLVALEGTRFCVRTGELSLPCHGETSDSPDADPLRGRWDLYLNPHFGAGTWRISAIQDRRVSEAGLSAVVRSFPLLALFSFAAALLISSIEVRRVHRPLAELVTAFRGMARGRFTQIRFDRRRDEYAGLGQAFNQLSRTLRRQFRLLATLTRMDQEILARPSVEDLLATMLPRLPAMFDCRAVAVLLGTKDSAIRVRYCAASNATEMQESNCATLVGAQQQLAHQTPGSEWEFQPIEVDGEQRGLLACGRTAGRGARRGLRRQIAGVAGRLAVALRNEEREQLLLRRAFYDSLTELPNRRLLVDRIQQGLLRAAAGGHGLALLYINLDRFRTINDSLGDGAGDQLLRHVARRLEACVSVHDTVARLGGDEFAILLADATVHSASAAAGRIVTTLAASLDMAGTAVVPQASVGIAVCPLDGQDADSLMRGADAAMHRAKQQGGNCAVFYEESMNQQASRRLLVETALRRALDCDALRLHYQPKVCSQDGRWDGVEALMRWQDPELGVVSPVEFIPIAEDCGLIHALGAAALRQAVLFARRCHDSGVPIGHVAVNVSMLQLRDASFAQNVEATLIEVALPPGLLQLEITESSVMEEAGKVVALLRRIRNLGVKIAIDDFGTGHSSLATLQNLPVDTLKIDRAFIRRIAVEPAALALVRAMIAVAHALDLLVVAEGVEDEDQARVLRREGCDICQGYLYSPAVSPADICEMATNWDLQRTG